MTGEICETQHILTLNGGSSSIKFAPFEIGDPLKRLLSGKLERIGLPDAAMEVTDLVTGQSERRAVAGPDHVSCVQPLARFLEQSVTFEAIAAARHLAPAAHFERKIFLSAKVRELTPAGEQKLEDFMLPNFMALLTELGREVGEESIAQTDPNERANVVRRALAAVRALIVIDNAETFPEPERVRLHQFLHRLPSACRNIVTSRRRADIGAQVVRLDRLERKDALDLLAELAKNNRHLQKATEQELGELYEITNGNPLLIKWAVGQLGRTGSQCRTIPEVCAFLKSAPKDNDPLE